MAPGGYANRVARIDLTAGTISYEEIDEQDARLYIGARGLGVKYLFDNGPQVDPRGPDNMLAVVNGPLTGSEATMSGRLAFVTKSPLTGTITDRERIYNLERHFNNLLGFAGDEDSLPQRYLDEPGTGGAEGSVVELDEMKAEYYAVRGWDDGVAPDAKLRELQIIS